MSFADHSYSFGIYLYSKEVTSQKNDSKQGSIRIPEELGQFVVQIEDIGPRVSPPVIAPLVPCESQFSGVNIESRGRDAE